MTRPNLTAQLSAFTAVMCLLLASTGFAQSQNGLERFQGAAKDAWIQGKVETMLALSEQVSAFAIDTDVESGVVTLNGRVNSDVNKELAEELTRGVSGVTEVQNELEISTDNEPGFVEQSQKQLAGASQDLLQWFNQASTTAEIKSRLLANTALPGLQIDVETQQDLIVLSGTVRSEAESALAEEIARNAANDDRVSNKLVVSN